MATCEECCEKFCIHCMGPMRREVCGPCQRNTAIAFFEAGPADQDLDFINMFPFDASRRRCQTDSLQPPYCMSRPLPKGRAIPLAYLNELLDLMAERSGSEPAAIWLHHEIQAIDDEQIRERIYGNDRRSRILKMLYASKAVSFRYNK